MRTATERAQVQGGLGGRGGGQSLNGRSSSADSEDVARVGGWVACADVARNDAWLWGLWGLLGCEAITGARGKEHQLSSGVPCPEYIGPCLAKKTRAREVGVG